MKTPDFLIIADRAFLKAYQVDHPGGRDPMPRLVDELEIAEARMKHDELYTDQAGAFPDHGRGTLLTQGNSAAERLDLQEENETRSLRRLAEYINKVLGEHKPERWALAAPAEINNALLNEVGAETRESLGRNIHKDLVKVHQSKLLRFFEED